MKRKSLHAVLEAFRGRRVLVVGDLILDEYLWGDAVRLSPEAPVPVVEVRQRTTAPGGAANVAANIMSLGGTPLLAGCIGRDAEAEVLRNAIQEHGIEVTGLVEVDDRPTTSKSRLFAHGQQIARIDRETRLPLPLNAEATLLGWIQKMVPTVDACILSDYGKGVLSNGLAARVLSWVNPGVPVVVDPKGDSYEKYRGATVIKPNLREVGEVFRKDVRDESELVRLAGRLSEMAGGSAILVTRGADGMTLFRQGAPSLHIAALAQHVFDVTGAGDTVVSLLALALAAGAELDAAVAMANCAAAVVVAKRGTATATIQELMGQLADEPARRASF